MIKQIIDEMQAGLTKLRREIQRSEAPKKGKCRCPNLCPIHCPHDHERFPVTPDLPLHVRVAKALGWMQPEHKVNPHYQDNPDKEDSMRWVATPPGWIHNSRKAIPDYPNDLVAAMGAWLDFTEGWFWEIGVYNLRFGKPRGYRFKIRDKTKCVETDSLPQAICEAIVAHAEGK